jgi:CheY-like chemotaxis protein
VWDIIMSFEPIEQDLSGRRVLVVEDDPQVMDFVSGQLEALGCICRRAETLSDAMAILDQDTFDLVLTDIALPKGVGGLDLAHWVRSVRPQTPVLLTSAYPTEALASGGTTARDFPLLRKPYRRADLARALNQVLAYAA